MGVLQRWPRPIAALVCVSVLSCLAAPALKMWHMLCALRPYASAHALRTPPTPPCACSRIRLRRAGQQRLPVGLLADHRRSCVSGRGHRHGEGCQRRKHCREPRRLSEWLLLVAHWLGATCLPQQRLARRWLPWHAASVRCVSLLRYSTVPIHACTQTARGLARLLRVLCGMQPQPPPRPHRARVVRPLLLRCPHPPQVHRQPCRLLRPRRPPRRHTARPARPRLPRPCRACSPTPAT
jgi:hypothetical protein